MTSAKEKESLRSAPFKKLSTDLFQSFVFFDRLLSSSAQLRTSTAFFDFKFRIISANPILLQNHLLCEDADELCLSWIELRVRERRFSAEINHLAGARPLLVIISGCSECNFLAYPCLFLN